MEDDDSFYCSNPSFYRPNNSNSSSNNQTNSCSATSSSNERKKSSQGNGDTSLETNSSDEYSASSKYYEKKQVELQESASWFHLVKSRFCGLKSKCKKNIPPKSENQKPIHGRATRHVDIEARYTFDTEKRPDETARPPIALSIGPSPTVREHTMKIGKLRPINLFDSEVPRLIHTHEMGEKVVAAKNMNKGYVSAKDIRNQNLRARNMVAGGIYKNDRYYATNMPVIEIGRTPIFTEEEIMQEKEKKEEKEEGKGKEKEKEKEKESEGPPVVQNMSAESIAPEGFGKAPSAESMAPDTLGKEPSAESMAPETLGKEPSAESVAIPEGGEVEKKKSAESTQSEDTQSVNSEVISSSYRLETSQSGFSDNLFQNAIKRRNRDIILSTESSFDDSTLSKKDSTLSSFYRNSFSSSHIEIPGFEYPIKNEACRKISRTKDKSKRYFFNRQNKTPTSTFSNLTYYAYRTQEHKPIDKKYYRRKKSYRIDYEEPEYYDRRLGNYWCVQFICELLGTFLYTVFCMLGAMNNPLYRTVLNNPIHVQGFILAGLMVIFGHLSGGHFNPAITVGVLFAGYMNLHKAIFYVFFQFVGAYYAAHHIHYWFPQERNYGATEPGLRDKDSRLYYHLHHVIAVIDANTCLVLEFIMTVFLVLLYLGVGTSRRLNTPGTAPVAIAFCHVALCHLTITVTGTSLNPARSFGPTMISKAREQWIYFAGPLIGAMAAGMAFRIISGFLLKET